MIEKLITIRKANNDTCAELSRKMWKHKDFISRVESGRKAVTVEMLLDYSRLYKVPVNWMMGLEDDK